MRATEAWTSQLPGYERDIAPVYSLVLATEPLPRDVWDVIGLDRRETFNDQRHLIIYGQRTADDRLVFGGRGAPYHLGSRIKPEFGSVFWNLSGKDQETARAHMTVAVPGATTASTGLPDNNKMGGAWIMGAGTTGAHIMLPGS